MAKSQSEEAKIVSDHLLDIRTIFDNIDPEEVTESQDELQTAIEMLSNSSDELQSMGSVPDAAWKDVDTLQEVATDMMLGERTLEDSRKVADLIEYGLAWYVEEPEECPGYAPDCAGIVSEFNLSVPVAE